jgi:hypothetical protein
MALEVSHEGDALASDRLTAKEKQEDNDSDVHKNEAIL